MASPRFFEVPPSVSSTQRYRNLKSPLINQPSNYMIRFTKTLLPPAVKKTIRNWASWTSAIRKKCFQDVSQSGELSTIRKLVKSGYPRYLVDVGANDGRTFSNSSYFTKQSGWRSILIEPHPHAFERLKQTYANNPHVVCIQIACSNIAGKQELFVSSDDLYSTLCQDDNDWFRLYRGKTSIEVETDTLTNILNKNGFPKDISVLSIDAEGMDYEVLLGLDFERYQPRIIVTEEYRWNIEKHNKKYRLLRESGYYLYKAVGCNTIWIRNGLS